MPCQTKNIRRIEDARDELLSAASLLQDVIDGRRTQTDVAGKLNITPQKLNHLLEKGFKPYVKARMLSAENLTDSLKALRTPGDRLLLHIFDEDKTEAPGMILMLPDYDEEHLWDVVERRLTMREYRIACMLTGCGHPVMTLREAASECGLTMERIRQCYAHALRKLRHPHTLRQVFSTMDIRMADCVDAMTDAADRALKRYEDAKSRYAERHALEAAATAYDRDVVPKDFEASTGRDGRTVPFDTVHVEDAGLSVRAHNVLLRAGVSTLNQLLETPVEDVWRMRNMGRRTFDEIVRVVRERLGAEIGSMAPDREGGADA